MIRDFTGFLGHIVGFMSMFILLETSAFTPPSKDNNLPAGFTTKDKADENRNDIRKILPEASGPPQRHLIDVDVEKAQDLATHFGKYSYGEIEHMRDDLHTHRIQSLDLGKDEYSNDVLFLERVLEDDLNTQLKALEEDMPDPYLFRYPDKNLAIMDSDETQELAQGGVVPLLPSWFQQGFLESMTICGILLAVLMMSPHPISSDAVDTVMLLL